MFRNAFFAGLAWLAVSTASAAPIIGGLGQRGPTNDLPRGLTLLSELNCAACHASGNPTLALRSRGPDLTGVGARLGAAHLRRFIARPHAIKPGTTMPDTLAALPGPERERIAEAITHHLLTRREGGAEIEPVQPGDAARGKQLYRSVGCAACHGVDSVPASAVPLGPLNRKYRLASLTAFLEAPLRHRPSGRMPDLKLNHFEAIDIATYLIGSARALEPFQVDHDKAEAGRRFFNEYGCARCHEPGNAVGATPKPLRELRPDRGCLSGRRGSWPDYALDADQLRLLRLAVKSHDLRLSPAEQVDLRLTQLNCLACHRRGALGGVPDALDPYFTGADPNLGDQGRLPPPLTGVGAKLRPDWLRKVLVHGESVRPYLHTRMPRFGAANVEPLVELFGRVDRLDPIKIDRVRDAKRAKEEGMKLAGNRGLNCVACHTFRLESAAPIRALDLTTMAERLQENWFHHYLRNPRRFQPLTIMPSFWPDGKAALTNILDGHTGRQIDALWQYLSYGRNVRPPSGIIREPLELKAGDEAVMLRRSYPSIGKRGIGVGYPLKVNLAFDAGQMRLGLIWRDEFIEASPAFRGQGSGAVRPLSREVIRFPDGPAFAVLRDARSPWPTNTARRLPGFQFKGYTLDALQRPTFRYEFRGGRVSDRFIDRKDAEGAAYLERRMTFEDLPAGAWFRVAVDRRIERLDPRAVRVGRSLRIRCSAPLIIRGEELLLPLKGLSELKLEYRW